MADDARYEIGEEIARGDFATVFRGRDIRLDREVAIKQLHAQYMNNPQQLERYWKEAQILARLEHPHVMTIYDVVPERGWLILELMKGSLKDQLGQRPIHLKDLRLTILFAARALSFFQQHNILHGDVKPSNLLIDRNNVIKLGDFGIARRLQNDEGSAIKGTTRYIAPEVVSDKFGPVGPHSDIYSLGFSAYELLCGDRFESLFPGLNMFGRDQQLAWIMWHSAPDRRLPRIKDVLEGVPDRLAAIIERMTEKDPARRYRSADQIIADLSGESGGLVTGPSPEEVARQQLEARQARRKRYLAIGAFAISALLCVAMLLPRGQEPAKKLPPAPTSGVVGKVEPEKNRIFLTTEEIIEINENDLLLLDGAVCQLDQLEPNDELSIQYLDNGKTKRIRAMRGSAVHFVGRLAKIDLEANQLELSEQGSEPRRFLFDGETPVSLNGKSSVPSDLQLGDSIDVQFWSDESGSHATALVAKRQLTAQGTVVNFDTNQMRLTFNDSGTMTTLPVARHCAMTINGRDNLKGRSITLGDLQRGDQIIALTYDADILSVDVQRGISDICEVWSVSAPEKQLTVVIDGDQVQLSAKDATITYKDKSVDLAFLRRGDSLLVAHDSPDRTNANATAIEVTDLVRNPRITALVICQQSYDDIQITPYEAASRDAEAVREALETGARVPEEQLALLKDLTRAELLQAITDFLQLQQKREQLVVYFVGQGYVNLQTGVPYLATRDFQLRDMTRTGLALRDLISTLEAFSAREKLLVLDTCHDVSAVELQSQPATGNLIRKAMIGDAVSRSVIVMGSCDTTRSGGLTGDAQLGPFGAQLALAFAGGADSDHSEQVDADELYRFVQKGLAASGQVPIRFQPDTRPPRLTPEAAAAVRSLLAELTRSRPSADFESEVASAQTLCGNQPDAQLAFALMKLKSGRTGESLEAFRTILGEHPTALIAYHAAIYQHLAKKEWAAAAGLVTRMVEQLAAIAGPPDDYTTHLLTFAGVARGFIESLSNDPASGRDLDAAADRLSAEGKEAYLAGREDFAAKFATTPEALRGSIRRFYNFDFDVVRQAMLDQLN